MLPVVRARMFLGQDVSEFFKKTGVFKVDPQWVNIEHHTIFRRKINVAQWGVNFERDSCFHSKMRDILHILSPRRAE